MTKIVKMVNHELTENQKIQEAEIIELPESLKSELKQCGSDITALNSLADAIITFAKENSAEGFILPGGSPAFNSIFSAKIAGKFSQYFSHSVRDYKEIKNDDGSVSKTNVFRHVEWIIIDPPKKIKNDTIRKFNDQQGNRDRSCRFAIIYNGIAYPKNEAIEKDLAKFESLGYEQRGKWSNTTWQVTTKSAKLVVMMSPFEGWSDDMERNIDHILSQYENNKFSVSREDAELAFAFQYEQTYTRIKENSKKEVI